MSDNDFREVIDGEENKEPAASDNNLHTTEAESAEVVNTTADAQESDEKACYRNEDIVPERSHLNIHFKTPSGSYQEMFRQMEQDGLVERFADPADRRKTLVRFTPKGYEACRQCEAALGDYFSSVMARLEPEQLAQMEALRGALMEAILAENAARTTKPKGEPNHDKDL